MNSFEKWFMSANLWTSVAVIALAVLSCIVLKRFARQYIKRDDVSGRKETNTRVLFSAVRYTIFAFAIITVLQINGVDVSSLVAGLGIVGIAVGFAVQDMLKDFIMGINVVRDEFFSVGDVVRYKNIEGTVVSFNIKATKISDINTGNIFTVCNRNISEIETLSDWLDIIVPFPYTVTADRARKICGEIVIRAEKIDNTSGAEFLGTDEFAQSSVNYRIRLHVSPALKLTTRRKCLDIIQDVFDENRISVPYPQLDVHLDKS